MAVSSLIIKFVLSVSDATKEYAANQVVLFWALFFAGRIISCIALKYIKPEYLDNFLDKKITHDTLWSWKIIFSILTLNTQVTQW